MRYVLYDFMCNVHKFIMMPPLTTTVNENGVPHVVDTTIPTGVIKNLWSYSRHGNDAIGVFLEGGKLKRKEYFSALPEGGYKGNRKPLTYHIKEGANLTTRLMMTGGISLFRCEGYEADDLMASMALALHKEEPDSQVDIVTGDMDLLPLVSDGISVYMRGTRTVAPPDSMQLHLYYKVTPDTWDAFIKTRSVYKGYKIPYNSVYLYKCLKGDKSDCVPAAVDGLGPKHYTELMEHMISDGVEFDKIFRYGTNFDTLWRPVLEKYFQPDALAAIKYIHDGIAPMPVEFIDKPHCINIGKLQPACIPYSINLV